MQRITLSSIGILVTVLYISLILYVRQQSIPCLMTMNLNELGDFLVGVFGPLMLLWVIISVYMQKSELKQNTAALKKQGEELEKSVQQHNDLVNINEKQLKIDDRVVSMQEEKHKEQENDFNYIYDKTNRKIEFTCVEVVIAENSDGWIEKTIDHHFAVNFGEIISHLVDFHSSEFKMDTIKNTLRDNCISKLGRSLDEKQIKHHFKVEEIEDITKGLLIYGLVTPKYVPSQKLTRGNSVSSSREFYRYELSEKLYSYRYWLEITDKFNSDLLLEHDTDATQINPRPQLSKSDNPH